MRLRPRPPLLTYLLTLLLTGESHCCSLLKHSCKKKFLEKRVKQIVKTCSTWVEVLQRLEKTFPVYETDLSVRTQIEQLPMLSEFPSAARVSEYVCDLGYMFSRMNVGSYGATEPHQWLMSKIPQRTWDDCRATSERKSRTHSYDELVDLLIELALEKENDSHMEKFLKKHLGRGGTPTPERSKGKDLKIPLTPTREVVRGGVTYVPLMRLNLMRVHPLCSTANLSMTMGGLIMPLTAITAVAVCCR